MTAESQQPPAKLVVVACNEYCYSRTPDQPPERYRHFKGLPLAKSSPMATAIMLFFDLSQASALYPFCYPAGYESPNPGLPVVRQALARRIYCPIVGGFDHAPDRNTFCKKLDLPLGQGAARRQASSRSWGETGNREVARKSGVMTLAALPATKHQTLRWTPPLGGFFVGRSGAWRASATYASEVRRLVKWRELGRTCG